MTAQSATASLPHPRPSARARPELTFQWERFSAIAHEAAPLVRRHWAEVALFQDKMTLDPDWDRAIKLDLAGILRIMTVRHEGALVGFCFNYVISSLLYAGLDDRALRRGKVPSPQEDLAFWAATPLALWGALNHLLYYQLPRIAVALLGPERLYTSTVKLVVGLIALAGCYVGQTWALQHYLGWRWAGPYLGTLPLTGFIALLWLEALHARRRRRGTRKALRRLSPSARRALQDQREALIRELDRARVDYLAERLEADPDRSA